MKINFYSKYLEIIEIIKDDDVALVLLDNLVEKIINYFHVTVINTHQILHKYEKEIKNEINSAYSSLISALQAFTKYFHKEFPEKEYPFKYVNIKNKESIENFVKNLILGIFVNRIN